MQTVKAGVLGVLETYAMATDEQGRKTLHWHMLAWIKNFKRLRQDIFLPKNDPKRYAAREKFRDYVNKVISATYGDEFRVQRVCCGNDDDESQSKTECNPPAQRASDSFEEKEPQVLRNARHKDHCLDVSGKVMQCKSCNKGISTTEMVANALNVWRAESKTSYSAAAGVDAGSFTGIGDGQTGKITGTGQLLPHNSWMDLAAYCYPYDFGPFNITDRPAEERERFWTDNKAARTAILRFCMDEHH